MTPNRTFIAVDLENLVGGPNPSDCVLNSALQSLATLHDPANQVVVAASHHLAARAAWRLPWARWLWRSGPDGADLALIEVLRHERVNERFAEVVVVSGDGIFAGTVASLAAAGTRTVVISSPSALSRRLRLAAQIVIEVDFAEVFHGVA